jgi:hypothetical protein
MVRNSMVLPLMVITLTKNNHDLKEYLIVRLYDLSVKKANLILENTLVLLIKQGKGPTDKLEKTYLETLRCNCDTLFFLVHQGITTKCKNAMIKVVGCMNQGQRQVQIHNALDVIKCKWLKETTKVVD